jgi:preprotein translocase subunit SecD
MKFRTLVIYSLLAIFLAGVFMQAQGSLEIRAASSTTVTGWQEMPTSGGDRVWVSPVSALTLIDIARVEPRTLPGGERAASFVFTADGARKMEQLSAAQANKPIALLLDGKIVWAPIVRSTISNEAMLTGVTPDVIERVLLLLER